MAEPKSYVMPPVTTHVIYLNVPGVAIPFAVIADLTEGGFLTVIEGRNPVAKPTPGPELLPGTILLAVPPEVAQQMRGGLQQSIKKARAGFGVGAGQRFPLEEH